MSLNADKTCPSCGVRFECKANTITLCRCREVVLSPTDREQLALHFSDCLCVDCLRIFSMDPERLLKELKNRTFNYPKI